MYYSKCAIISHIGQANGTPLHELQQLGGWSNYETVLRYVYLSSEHLRVAAERVYDTKLPQ